MPVTDRDYIRGSHPPACTCANCDLRRRSGRPRSTPPPIENLRSPLSPIPKPAPKSRPAQIRAVRPVSHTTPGVQWKKVLAFLLPLVISAAILLAYAVAGMDSGGRSFAEGTCAEKLQSADEFLPKWEHRLYDLETQAEALVQDVANGVPKAIEESEQLAIRIEGVKAVIKKYEDLIAPCLTNTDGK